MKTVHVQYFALLREQRGIAREDIATAAETPAELYAELRARHGFTLEAGQLRVAVGGRICPVDTPAGRRFRRRFHPPRGRRLSP